MTVASADPCPGCGVVFAPYSGEIHPYIGASAACWALFSAWQVGGVPPGDILAGSEVPERSSDRRAFAADHTALTIDAYAAQHCGRPSPKSIQSVAVHLLALHGVFARGLSADSVLWVRRRALRTRGVFSWLEPPPVTAALTIRHVFGDGVRTSSCTPNDYVWSVYAAWSAVHADRLEEWFRRFVDEDSP